MWKNLQFNLEVVSKSSLHWWDKRHWHFSHSLYVVHEINSLFFLSLIKLKVTLDVWFGFVPQSHFLVF